MKNLLLIISLFLSAIIQGQDYKLKFDEIDKFDRGFAQTKKDGKVGVIDSIGNIVIPNEYEEIDRFDLGIAQTKKFRKIGLIDIKGHVIIPNEYEAIDKFDRGLALTKKNGKVGLIDIKGNIIIVNEYDAIELKDGIATVLQNGTTRAIKIPIERN